MFSKSKLLKKKKAKKARANKHTMWFSKREFNNTFILVQGKKKKNPDMQRKEKARETTSSKFKPKPIMEIINNMINSNQQRTIIPH